MINSFKYLSRKWQRISFFRSIHDFGFCQSQELFAKTNLYFLWVGPFCLALLAPISTNSSSPICVKFIADWWKKNVFFVPHHLNRSSTSLYLSLSLHLSPPLSNSTTTTTSAHTRRPLQLLLPSILRTGDLIPRVKTPPAYQRWYNRTWVEAYPHHFRPVSFPVSGPLDIFEVYGFNR